METELLERPKPRTTFDPFAGTDGPHNAEVLVVGEAYGEIEESAGRPFVGSSGYEIKNQLANAGFDPKSILYTNVVNRRPSGNAFHRFLTSTIMGNDSGRAKYRQVYANWELREGHLRLIELISIVKPKLIIGLGAWALWALSHRYRISNTKGYKTAAGIATLRGSQEFTDPSLPFDPTPVIFTYHPAAVMRSMKLQHIAVHDLRRANHFIIGKRQWTDHRKFDWKIYPTANEVEAWVERFLSFKNPVLELNLDLETYAGQIHIFGVRDKVSCLCIPFMHVTKEGTTPTYSLEDWRRIYAALRRLLVNRRVGLVGQNLSYDIQYLAKWFGYKPRVLFDTMVAQHICWSSDPKGLDHLASIYCHYYNYWKDERKESLDSESTEDGCRYNCLDLEYTFEIWKVLRTLLQQLKLTSQYEDRMELFHILFEMMEYGVRINMELKSTMQGDMVLQMQEVVNFIERCIPQRIKPGGNGTPWYRSNSKLMDLLYRELKLRPVFDQKSGNPTVSREALRKLSERHEAIAPLFNAIVVLRSMGVFNSTFLRASIDGDERARTAYGVAATTTFRLNSTKNNFGTGLNLTNIPRDRNPLTPFNAIEELS